MNTNYSLGNYQQSVNFNGKVDKKSAKLAKELGGEVLENIQNLASKTSKNTTIKLNEMGGEYGVYAFNNKMGYGLTVGMVPKEKLAKTIGIINPKRVDEGIVNSAIKSIKETAASGPMNTTEKKMLREEARETLKLQREIGVQKPFWSETKKLMAEAEDRADKERLAFDREYAAWKNSMLMDRLK
ncbi:MAG: hypothetical protein K6E29_08325 [Cyanobacteria bacterium RUI128]|nr:hypothetical protein [Cyanobacteria bacterium RUI128]